MFTVSDEPWVAKGFSVFQGADCIAIFDTDVGSLSAMVRRAELAAKAVNAHDELVEQKERLAVALANLIPRFQRALIQSGTDAEYAEEATREHRRALEFAAKDA